MHPSEKVSIQDSRGVPGSDHLPEKGIGTQEQRGPSGAPTAYPKKGLGPENNRGPSGITDFSNRGASPKRDSKFVKIFSAERILSEK